MVENSTSDPTRSCLSARKSRQKRIGPAARLDRVDRAGRTSPSGRPDGARTRTSVTTPKLPPPPLSAHSRSGCSSGAGVDQPPVGGDDVGRDEVVDAQAVAAPEPADAAAEREPADAGVGDEAARRRETERLRRRVDVAPGRAALDPGPPPFGVHPHAAHRRQVDHHARRRPRRVRRRCARRRGSRSAGRARARRSTAATTSAAPWHRTMTAGRRSIIAFQTARRVVVARRRPGVRTSPDDRPAQPVDRRGLGRHVGSHRRSLIVDLHSTAADADKSVESPCHAARDRSHGNGANSDTGGQLDAYRASRGSRCSRRPRRRRRCCTGCTTSCCRSGPSSRT